MRVYLLVMVVAAVVTYLTTPLARWLAERMHAITPVRERDVHTEPTPRMGGVAMLFGLTATFVIGSQVPFLSRVFQGTAPWAVLASAAVVCLLGVADDIWELDWLTKLSGQVLAAGLMAWQGIQMVSFPIAGLTIGSSRISLIVTILIVVVAINAINFVDGLDGLAAGMVAIGAVAYFIYTYSLTRQVNPGDYSSLATFIIAALVGICLGFLPHNFSPARIFMGDSGSMLLGLIIAAATIAVTGNIDPKTVSDRQAFPAFLPILLPIAILALPLIDMLLAVGRRLKAGQSPFHADRMHLHHRLLELGHSHRRAVLIMYMWTAVFSFSGAALVVFSTTQVLIGMGISIVVALALTVGPLSRIVRKGRRRPPARPGPPSSPDEQGSRHVTTR